MDFKSLYSKTLYLLLLTISQICMLLQNHKNGAASELGNRAAAPGSINKATEVAAAFRGSSASDPAVRMALAH